jgi:uncharacterized protein (TIGR02145 family)
MDFYLTRVIVFHNFSKNFVIMKRFLFLLPIFCILKLNAQNFLISFSGSGGSTTVSSVKVENMTKGTSLTLNGSDILQLTSTTGVNTIEYKQSSELKIYPNPMTDNSILEIYPPLAGNAVISVVDMSGKPVAQTQSYLENSRQDFRLSGIKNGFYIINVEGNNYHFSGKLFSNGKSNGKTGIEKVNNVTQEVDKKTVTTASKGTHATIDIAYTTGDRLKFTGISGNYSTVVIDIPTTNKVMAFNFIACTDGDYNNYPVVAIGTQVWMAENLKTPRFRNGDLIGTTTPVDLDISGESTPKYQWAYAGNESNVAIYGRLYTWYAVTDSRNVCPAGWHIPTADEFTALTSYLGSSPGSKLKEAGTIHWRSPSAGTNESGFTALPGGRRDTGGGFLDLLHGLANWWSSDESAPPYTNYGSGCLRVDYDLSNVLREGYSKILGCSVRCLKD